MTPRHCQQRHDHDYESLHREVLGGDFRSHQTKHWHWTFHNTYLPLRTRQNSKLKRLLPLCRCRVNPTATRLVHPIGCSLSEMVVASPLRAVSLSPDSALTSSAVVRHHRSIRGVNIVVPPRARRGLAMMSTAPSATALMMAVLAVSGELLAKSSAASSVDASVESEESTRIHVTDVHARDPKGFTTLHLAADKGICHSSRRRCHMLHTTLSWHPWHSSRDTCIDTPDTMCSFTTQDKSSERPVSMHTHVVSILPCLSGNAESITTQLEQGADINAMSRKGTTPLHLAAAKGKKDAAAVLVAAGAILNVASATGDTPLHLAADKVRATCSLHATGTSLRSRWATFALQVSASRGPNQPTHH